MSEILKEQQESKEIPKRTGKFIYDKIYEKKNKSNQVNTFATAGETDPQDTILASESGIDVVKKIEQLGDYKIILSGDGLYYENNGSYEQLDLFYEENGYKKAIGVVSMEKVEDSLFVVGRDGNVYVINSQNIDDQNFIVNSVGDDMFPQTRLLELVTDDSSSMEFIMSTDGSQKLVIYTSSTGAEQTSESDPSQDDDFGQIELEIPGLLPYEKVISVGKNGTNWYVGTSEGKIYKFPQGGNMQEVGHWDHTYEISYIEFKDDGGVTLVARNGEKRDVTLSTLDQLGGNKKELRLYNDLDLGTIHIDYPSTGPVFTFEGSDGLKFGEITFSSKQEYADFLLAMGTVYRYVYTEEQISDVADKFATYTDDQISEGNYVFKNLLEYKQPDNQDALEMQSRINLAESIANVENIGLYLDTVFGSMSVIDAHSGHGVIIRYVGGDLDGDITFATRQEYIDFFTDLKKYNLYSEADLDRYISRSNSADESFQIYTHKYDGYSSEYSQAYQDTYDSIMEQSEASVQTLTLPSSGTALLGDCNVRYGDEFQGIIFTFQGTEGQPYGDISFKTKQEYLDFLDDLESIYYYDSSWVSQMESVVNTWEDDVEFARFTYSY